jgi:rSAM/selenodomain-associated transferase 1
MPHPSREPERSTTAAPRPAVVIFAKAPVPGRVKTRLAAGIGIREAAELQAAMLCDTAEMVSSVLRAWSPAAEPLCAAAEPEDARALRDLLPPEFGLVSQGSGDLGERLARVFGRLLAVRTPVLALGGDCPDLTPELLRCALEKLGRADGVLGPAQDGGYWTIGLQRFDAELFRGMPWSTAQLAERTRARFGERRLTLEELPPLADLDRPADLLDWSRRPNAAFRRTLAWCRDRRLA